MVKIANPLFPRWNVDTSNLLRKFQNSTRSNRRKLEHDIIRFHNSMRKSHFCLAFGVVLRVFFDALQSTPPLPKTIVLPSNALCAHFVQLSQQQQKKKKRSDSIPTNNNCLSDGHAYKSRVHVRVAYCRRVVCTIRFCNSTWVLVLSFFLFFFIQIRRFTSGLLRFTFIVYSPYCRRYFLYFFFFCFTTQMFYTAESPGTFGQ